MQKQGQKLSQKQSLSQKLSPQQIQYIKLLQLPTIGLEQRVKEELEMNPVLEEADPSEEMESLDAQQEDNEWEKLKPESEADTDSNESEPDPVDRNEEIDWESFLHNTEFDENSYGSYRGSGGDEDWRDLPNPYHESLLEELEQQVGLLELDETEKLIADQILGSLDEDGYFRRDPEAVVDNIAFNYGSLSSTETVEKVRKMIQTLEPAGIASRDLRECLLVQLELMDREDDVHKLALRMVRDEWTAFERKHFEKLKNRLEVDEEVLKEIFEHIKGLDPKPGAVSHPDEDNKQYIEPDFEVYFEPDEKSEQEDEGEFVIRLNQRNVPPLRISPSYKRMWDELKKGDSQKKEKDAGEAKSFIKDKVESAQWFIESIRQRQNTLMNTMKTIVELQKDFFKFGEGLRPMILKDIAERVNLDISTISRVVNGKYVQTNFGVYELKYFFSEGLETESGEEVSSRVVKNLLKDLIDDEDKSKPYSDQALTEKLQKEGFKVARRTVSKYREQLNIPVARLRKQ
ncbi:MAG: RNA polymerase factor sigma-54, partial [Balneolaceae bacterium]